MNQDASLLSNHNQTHPSSSRTLVQRLWSAKMGVFFLIIIGFALRTWGTGYGLPYLYHPDEPLLQNSVMMVKTNDLHPRFFGYGSLFFYINAIAYWVYYFLGRMIGLFNSAADIPNLQVLGLGVGRVTMPTVVLTGRLVSVFLGTLCIPVAYWAGTRLSSRRVGVLAAVFVTFSPSLVDHSQFVTPNMLTTFLVLLTLAVLVRSSTWRPYVASLLIGIVFGCAVASKYNAAVLILPIGVTYLLRYGWQMIKKPDVYLSFAIAGLTFLAVTPYAILDFDKFWTDTIFHLRYYSVNSHPGMEGNTVRFYLTYLFKQEGLLAFLSLIPIIHYVRTRNHAGLILVSFALPYTLYTSSLDIRNDRTILLVIPILFLMAADALRMIWQWIMKSESPRLRQVGVAALTAFIVLSTAYTLYQTVEANVAKTTIDGREYARQWIETNVPAGTTIGIESYAPFVDPADYRVDYFPQLALNSPDWYREQGYELLVFSSFQYARYYADPERYSEQVNRYDALWESFPEVMQFDQNGITIRIYQVRTDD